MELNHVIDRKPDETVVYLLRRHWIVYAGELLTVAFLSAVPAAAYALITIAWPSLLTGPSSRPALVLVTSAYCLMLWVFFIGTFVDYYLDAWVVTTQRIIDVQQHGLFSRTISELDLTRIQDVTSEVKGIIPSVLGYGDVYVQTAGEVERFVFEQIPHPHDIRKHLLELVDKDRQHELAPISDKL